MPAKRTRRDPDAQADLIGLAKAKTAAHQWATKAVDLRAAGKVAEAKAAEKRAMMFLRRVIEIEKRYPPMTRERHMLSARESE